ncbi:MAG: hypothetical protein Q6363_006115 [Candidatus Njordarchaeota archaeon]
MIDRIKQFIFSITPLFVMREGIYFLCKSEIIADATIIFEYGGEVEDIGLTGPIDISTLSDIVYRHVRMDQYLKALMWKLEENLKSIVNKELSLDFLEYLKYVKFFIKLAEVEFKSSLSKAIDEKFLRLKMGNIEKAIMIIENEKNKSLKFIHDWRIEDMFRPSENRIRVITKSGVLEYSSRQIEKNVYRVYGETKRQILDIEKATRILFLLSMKNLEAKRVRYLSVIEKKIREGLLTKDQMLIALTKTLLEESSIRVPIEVDGIRTYLGLRIHNKDVYVFINTSEYVVKEVINRNNLGAYVYFPPIDVCVKLQTEEKENGESVVVPVEAPVILDEYAHPSIPVRSGKRTICLGTHNQYVIKLINAAKEVAIKGKMVKLSEYNYIVGTSHQALKEILITAFRIMRYGYRPGANPHQHAVNCVRYHGVKILSPDELAEIKRKGIEIIEGDRE